MHAINAIAIAQDLHNYGRYYILTYDSNFPGEVHYFMMKCSKISCVTDTLEKEEWYGFENNKFYIGGQTVSMPKSLNATIASFSR